ncbi:MAG: MBL fold metallo-hydrolase, partial [Clostridia bacterium]|nr:MBL fold metallo-hydrolase [Clostridia bacterium]
MTDFAKQYEVKEIYENTYSILEKGFEGLDTYMYLLVGDEKALLVDCGFGIIDLKKIVGEITDKPLITVCTHGHHDHVMGVTNLTDCYI